VKRYREERELAMVLAMDISASADFGSVRRSKREFATEIAGTLAISATRSSDKVALLLFTDQIELYLPPRKGRRHILRVLREALHLPAKHRGTNVSAALAFLNRVLPRRSIIFLLTDFLHSFGPGENSPTDSRIEPLNVPQKKTPHPGPLPWARGEEESSPVHLRGEVHGEGRPRAGRDTIQEIGLTNARHDLVCLHLHDPREASLPPAGLLTIEDSETGELLELDSTRSAVRKKFADTNAERLAELDRAFQRAGVDTLRFSTTEPFAQTLQHFFETRRGRRRG